MMQCRKVAVLLVDFFADELPPHQTKHIREHLNWCPVCSSRVERYQQLMRAARMLPDAPVPPSVLERLQAALCPSPPPT